MKRFLTSRTLNESKHFEIQFYLLKSFDYY